jgi:hypothetical protein
VAGNKIFAERKTIEQTESLRQLIDSWVKQANKSYAGEKFFVEKRENNPARRLSQNRIKFIVDNALQIYKFAQLLEKKGLIATEELYRYLNKMNKVEPLTIKN